MNYLGIDYGEKRIGLSCANELGIAMPLAAANQKTKEERFSHMAHIIKERKIQAIVIGYPINMDGTIGPRAEQVDDFIREIEALYQLPVHKVDERLTSHQVEADMMAFGFKKKKTVRARKKERASGTIDSRAATLILQDYLEHHIR